MQNNFSQIEKKISLPNEKYSKTYTLEIKQTVTSMDKVCNNTIILDVEKNFIKKDDFGYLFSVIVLSRKQSNLDGLRGMEDFLSKIQDKILLYTDRRGTVKSIANTLEIEEKWDDFRSEFVKKFKRTDDINGITDRITNIFNDKDEVLNVFKQSEIGTLLFPPIYFPEIKENKIIAQAKLYRDFFGPYTLPFRLNMHEVTSNDNTTYGIGRAGIIDTNLLSEDQIKLYFRRLHGTYNLIVDFDGHYSELYNINNSDIIDNAFQLFSVKVGDIYSFEQITTVTS